MIYTLEYLNTSFDTKYSKCITENESHFNQWMFNVKEVTFRDEPTENYQQLDANF